MDWIRFNAHTTSRALPRWRVWLGAVLLCAASAGHAQPMPDPVIDLNLKNMAAQLAHWCPLADSADQAAFDSCRKHLFKNTTVRENLSKFTLWGRQNDPNLLLKKTNLTQFAPDVLAGMYMPLFMFDGSYKLEYNEREKMYLGSMGVAFRNRLPPGQFPYPFWHDANKWAVYENAKTMLFWFDPKTTSVRVMQFSAQGSQAPLVPLKPVTQAAFDGHWVWTDRQQKTQPMVTLFDGLFSDDNPYKEKVAQAYQSLALPLRDGQCMECHVPNNPNGMSRLVLLQTPAHAASEIKRILKQVSSDSMPKDEYGIEQALDPKLKALLLEKGTAFDQVVDLAHAWEDKQASP